MALHVYIDGGSRGNPGPAAAGVAIFNDAGEPLFEAGYFLGAQTNNYAEYLGLIRALEQIHRMPPDTVRIYADSELLVRQITGDFAVKSANLAPLHEQAQRLLLRVHQWSIHHVRRAKNHRADELVNRALDERADIVATGSPPGTPASTRTSAADGGKPTTRTPPAPSESSPSAGPVHPLEAGRPRAIRVVLARPPAPGGCPVGGPPPLMVIEDRVPQGLCLYAAHGILPTLLAIQHTAEGEAQAVPTLTVRCPREGCGARMEIAPQQSENGRPPGSASP